MKLFRMLALLLAVALPAPARALESYSAYVLGLPTVTSLAGTELVTVIQGAVPRNASLSLLFSQVCGGSNQATCLKNAMPTPVRNGDILYWNAGAQQWQLLAGNNSGSLFLLENASGTPSWQPATGSGVTCNNGLTGGTTSGSCAVDPTYFPSAMGGLVLSNDGTSPNTVIDIAAGVATSDDFSTLMKLSANFTKNVNAAWASGTGNGCLDTGSSLTASSWYAIFIIYNATGPAVDLLCSKQAAGGTAPTMPSGYTKKKYLGSIRTDGSAHVLAFVQVGNFFSWHTYPQDVNTTLSTTPTNFTLTNGVPLGFPVLVDIQMMQQNASTNIAQCAAYPLSSVDPTLSGSLDSHGSSGVEAPVASTGMRVLATITDLLTNTSGQIRAVCSESDTFQISVVGYHDISRGSH